MKLPEFWKTGVAVLVLGGLGAYIYFVESKKETTGDEKPKEKVFALEKAKVKEVAIDNSGGESVRLVKDGEAWKIAAPFAAPADAPAVDSLVGTLESMRIDEVAVENATALAEYGLDKPRIAVAVTQEGASAPARLQLGAKLADGSGVYAKTPDKPRVFTIPSYVESSLDKKPFDLRDRDVLHLKRDDVKTVAVSGGGVDYALAKDDKGEWAFTKPVSTRAGRWSVDGLLGSVEGLRMDSVAAEDAKDFKPFALDKPARVVTLGLASGGSKVLEIGSAAPGEKKLYARPSGSSLVAVIPNALDEQLAKGMKDLRANRLLEVATYEVEGFDVQEGATKRVFAKSTTKDKDGIEKAQWKKTAPEAKDLETTKVEDALFKLGGVEVQEFVDQPKDAAAYGLDAPLLKVAIRMGASKGEASVEIGRKDGSVYARRAGDSAVLKLDTTKADELVKAFQEL
jgi:Domain of unknown function (DUF4340)